MTSSVLAALLLVAGCGGDDDDDGAAPTTTAAASDGVFPVTVEHAFGTTEIDEAPERVVSVGYTEQDTLLALGVTPVGITEWYGDFPHATWPWAADELGDADPEVLSITDGFQYEHIAALDPDLIIGVNAGMDEDAYERLSAIAPTVAQKSGATGYFSPWDEQTLLIGQAIGRETEAEALIDGIKDDFADAADAHPEFAGAKAVFLQNAIYDGEAIAYQEGLSTDFLTDLGFTVPPELDAFVPAGDSSQAYIPLEQLSVLDAADVLIWGTEAAEDRVALEDQPLYGTLEEVEAGRLVFTGGLLAGAIYFSSPLSLPFVLDHLVPALASTLGGDGPVELDTATAEPVPA